jgi:hypothetical protein
LVAADAQAVHRQARTEAERKRAFLEAFVERNWGTGPDAWEKFEEWQRENEERRREGAAFRARQDERERASASRWVERSQMPRRKRRRQTYVWRRYSEGGPGLQEYRPGALGVPYDLC